MLDFVVDALGWMWDALLELLDFLFGWLPFF